MDRTRENARVQQPPYASPDNRAAQAGSSSLVTEVTAFEDGTPAPSLRTGPTRAGEVRLSPRAPPRKTVAASALADVVHRAMEEHAQYDDDRFGSESVAPRKAQLPHTIEPTPAVHAVREAEPPTEGGEHSRPWFPRVEECGMTPASRLVRQLFVAFNGTTTSISGYIITVVVNLSIVVSIGAMMAASVPEYRKPGTNGSSSVPDVFRAIELVVIVIFVSEFCVRLGTIHACLDCDLEAINGDDPTASEKVSVFGTTLEGYPFLRGAYKTLKFLSWPLTWVDIASFLPFFLDVASDGKSDIGSTTLLRVLRISRALLLLKITSRTDAFRVVVRTLKSSANALFLMLAYLAILSIFFSALIFYCEQGEWDEVEQQFMRDTIDGVSREPSPFRSILHALYFVAVTMTTVGYGDLVTTSPAGRIVTIFIMMSGVLTLALPASILTSRFPVEYAHYERRRQQRRAQVRNKVTSVFASMRLLSNRKLLWSPSSKALTAAASKVTPAPLSESRSEGLAPASPSFQPSQTPRSGEWVATSRATEGSLLYDGGDGVRSGVSSPRTLTSASDDPPSAYDLMDKLRKLERNQATMHELLMRAVEVAEARQDALATTRRGSVGGVGVGAHGAVRAQPPRHRLRTSRPEDSHDNDDTELADVEEFTLGTPVM